jgi:hypothetical protein
MTVVSDWGGDVYARGKKRKREAGMARIGAGPDFLGVDAG